MKYIKKPIIIEAIQWTGDASTTKISDAAFSIAFGKTIRQVGENLIIETTTGKMEASLGDYIIKWDNGEFFPCKPDIFEETYEIVKEK